ncbi:MAG: pirin family protein [Saprospiraceae bacterium]|nr:pirin family protein [Saprospiraceae bacterium]
MKRIDFLKQGILGTGIFVASGSIGSVIENNIDELQKLEIIPDVQKIIGFNHIPNNTSKIMSNTVLHKAESRGKADHGWLLSQHSFSFANYYNPDRMHFGLLRVLNDDIVSGGMGFGKHPHDNMEIISIPLQGALEHQDSMGSTAVIKKGDIQVMSAGTGITHSEKNKNHDEVVKFLQIWVFPNKKNVAPRYDQITLKESDRHNKLQQILSPNVDDDGVWIHQDAWFHLGSLDKGNVQQYHIKKSGNGVYAFIVDGEVTIGGQKLGPRDGFGIWDVDMISIIADNKAEILLMEVPMTV